MTEFWVIFFAMLAFAWVADYLYVNVGDNFEDQYQNVYKVAEKNLVSVRLVGDYEQKTIPIMVLCMQYMKVDMTDF